MWFYGCFPVVFCCFVFVMVPSSSVVDLIRIGLNADPDPTFYLNVDPDTDGSREANQSGSGSCSDFEVTKDYIFT
jgi:hypothetical protein